MMIKLMTWVPNYFEQSNEAMGIKISGLPAFINMWQTCEINNQMFLQSNFVLMLCV